MQNHLKLLKATYMLLLRNSSVLFTIEKLVFKDKLSKNKSFHHCHALHTHLTLPNHFSQEMFFQSNIYAAWHRNIYTCKVANYIVRSRMVMVIRKLLGS